MKRREFITLLGGATAAWPLAARAQQLRAPTIGFLHSASADGNSDRVRAFRQGLKEAGLIEGENVAVEYRWADHQVERLPALANELVRHGVVAIAAMGPPAAFAAKAATTAIPIVFVVPEDPVRLGLVTSLARPGGNLTGVNFFPAEVSAKRLELLRELAPQALRIAVLADPNNPSAESTLRDLEAASRATGLQIQVFKVSSSRARSLVATAAGYIRVHPQVGLFSRACRAKPRSAC
jgi:putative tryptophan/tyrosine transport system substrate-binding protein